MAEASTSGTSGEKDVCAVTLEPYRRICEHYSRGCSLVVSFLFMIWSVRCMPFLCSRHVVVKCILADCAMMRWSHIK